MTFPEVSSADRFPLTRQTDLVLAEDARKLDYFERLVAATQRVSYPIDERSYEEQLATEREALCWLVHRVITVDPNGWQNSLQELIEAVKKIASEADVESKKRALSVCQLLSRRIHMLFVEWIDLKLDGAGEEERKDLLADKDLFSATQDLRETGLKAGFLVPLGGISTRYLPDWYFRYYVNEAKLRKLSEKYPDLLIVRQVLEERA